MNLASPLLLQSLMSLVILQLLCSLYLCYRIVRNLEEDLDYSVTRIFLSKRSVKGMKVLMISLLLYAVINLALILGAEGSLLEFGVRINLLILFGGLMFYFWEISQVTEKKGS